MTQWDASGMTQEYEYYEVDTGTWQDKRLLKTVTSCTITRDSTSDTLGSATFAADELYGEMYVRAYLITIQNRVRQRHPLGTFLVQSPSMSFDGKVSTSDFEAYTPLIELKENNPPVGYYIPKNASILDKAADIIKNTAKARAPIVYVSNDAAGAGSIVSNFVSDGNETWVKYLTEYLACANYRIDLDEFGRILLSPIQPIRTLQPTFVYTDDNSSILYRDISVTKDIYSVPNVVEVTYSDKNYTLSSVAKNEDPDSATSIPTRGREIIKRITDPKLNGVPTQPMIDEYARQELEKESTIQCKVTYKHGYNNVRVGDCIRIDYRRAGILIEKAQVISQKISCKDGCPVSETAVFNMPLWG